MGGTGEIEIDRGPSDLGALIDQRISMWVEARGAIEPERFSYTPGRGIDATLDGVTIPIGNTALLRDHGMPTSDHLIGDHPEVSKVFVTRDSQLLGAIARCLYRAIGSSSGNRCDYGMASRLFLLTGDAKAVADIAAKQLNIDEVAAELLPKDKPDRVRSPVAGGRKVATVGYGINDAPPLKEALSAWRWVPARTWRAKARTWCCRAMI